MERQVHEKLNAYITKHQLISNGDELILGVSGGADSMMMLHYFFTHRKAYGISIKVAHIHHGLREAAEEDAKLVEKVCKAYGVPFFRHDCQIAKIAKESKVSEEEAGRTERYNFFISLLNEKSKIVTAHNMNDQAETMLMRFVRGTDIKGLSGIAPKRQQIIRPLLCLTREEIEAYCDEVQMPFRHDETNFKPIYTRNKMRLIGIPYIREHFNPNIIQSLGEHSEIYQEENDFLESYTDHCYLECSSKEANRIKIRKSNLNSYHSYLQRRIFMRAISELIGSKDITLKHLNSCATLLELQVGKVIHLPQGVWVRNDYEDIVFEIQSEEVKAYCYKLEMGTTCLEEMSMQVQLRMITLTQYKEKQRINQKNENNYTKYIDYGRIKSGLQIRTKRPGDYIQLGNGTKKLKKLFTDDKISKDLRDTMPLIADESEIVWAIGSRLNTKYYVTDSTKEILEIKILKGHE